MPADSTTPPALPAGWVPTNPAAHCGEPGRRRYSIPTFALPPITVATAVAALRRRTRHRTGPERAARR